MSKSFQKKDEELYAVVAKAKEGNPNFYTAVYELSFRYLFKIIHDIVKNEYTTEDLLQETYIQIFNKLDTLQEPRAFYVWAGRIATNITLRYVQKNSREVLAAGNEEDEAGEFIFDRAAADQEMFIPEEIIMDGEKRRLLGLILDGLSAEQKLSIQYYYYEEMSVAEIAEAMNCSTGTVKSRLNYARKTIKEAVIQLEKTQGTKLYSLGGLPLFWLLFRDSAAAMFATPAVDAVVETMIGSVATKLAAFGLDVAGAGAAASIAPAAAAPVTPSAPGSPTPVTPSDPAPAISAATPAASVPTVAVPAAAAVPTAAAAIPVVGKLATLAVIAATTFTIGAAEVDYHESANDYSKMVASEAEESREREEAREANREMLRSYQSILAVYESEGYDRSKIEDQILEADDHVRSIYLLGEEAYRALNEQEELIESVFGDYFTAEQLARLEQATDTSEMEKIPNKDLQTIEEMRCLIEAFYGDPAMNELYRIYLSIGDGNRKFNRATAQLLGRPETLQVLNSYTKEDLLNLILQGNPVPVILISFTNAYPDVYPQLTASCNSYSNAMVEMLTNMQSYNTWFYANPEFAERAGNEIRKQLGRESYMMSANGMAQDYNLMLQGLGR